MKESERMKIEKQMRELNAKLPKLHEARRRAKSRVTSLEDQIHTMRVNAQKAVPEFRAGCKGEPAHRNKDVILNDAEYALEHDPAFIKLRGDLRAAEDAAEAAADAVTELHFTIRELENQLRGILDERM